ncbi:TRAPP II complex [Xylogone sp. PMI_703]|nr:TRAPP II complex [Xylogone sp. PMI_703]
MLDQLSPIAPARVRVLLLPTGQIQRARFLSFIERLQPENVVRLGDISPDSRPNRNMFSPLAFPTGSIVYDFVTHYPPPSHLSLTPFEMWREPFVIIGVADAVELSHISYKSDKRRSLNGNGPPARPDHNIHEIYQELEDVRDQYPKALVHQVLLFDYAEGKLGSSLPEGIVGIPVPAESKRTTIKTVMCDISSMLLAEMTTLAKSLQALSTIESPSQSQGVKLFQGASWSTGQEDGLGRRNSQFSLPSRSDSPAGSTDRNQVRMSMPAALRSTNSDSNASSPLGRPSTPTSGAETDPGHIEEHSSKNGAFKLLAHRSDSMRETSRDRISIQGFGSNSISERARNKGKGRIVVVVGGLFLCAGRWIDALRESVEGAVIARNNLDHLWHAKALENTLVSMLALGWSGLDFEVPQVCYVSSDKAPAPMSPPPVPSKNGNRRVALQNLNALLPELTDRILNLYARAANNTGESLPQFPFSEIVIRLSKLLSTVHSCGGKLNDAALQHLVLGTPFPEMPNLEPPRLNINPKRTEILTMLLRAYPAAAPHDRLPVVDRVTILSGIASVLSSLGYNRKKAMIIRELVYVLIPALVQARKIGAAEMGVHPAAGLAALGLMNSNTNGAAALELSEGDVETGMDDFLGLLGQIYGSISISTSSAEDKHEEPFSDSDEAIISRILRTATIRSFGNQALKMDTLRACINLSEALPDFRGVLKFTADLLRTAGSGVAPGPHSDDASPSMSREEQIRLATNISRTVGAAKKLGLAHLGAEYWDEFLVRGVELEALPPSRTPIPHTKTELPGATAVTESREINPFIYNPFLRPPDSTAIHHLLVAGEGAVFKVTLQNPYEFDLEIESIKLDSEGTEFESGVQKTVIGPYRTQLLSLSGTAKASGSLKITGCRVKVRGCRERRFPIFSEPWAPQPEIKIKARGLEVVSKHKERPMSTGSIPSKQMPTSLAPKITSLELNVIDKQPVVVVKSTTLSQSALMVLEGERQQFSVTLQNLSHDTPVDLVLFSFKDSTQAPLQTAMSNRDASPVELYEYELIFSRKQALRWVKKPDQKPYIKPGGSATFELEILGKPGLTSATVHIDYAFLGVSPDEVQSKFHTRQVSLPLTVTVNASIELARMDVHPLNDPQPLSLWKDLGIESSGEESFKSEDFVLLVMDFRNAWPSPLEIQLDIAPEKAMKEEILPGNISRIMFPVRRIYLENPTAPIPALDPSRQRQFVVSAGRISVESERASREAFWYREELLKTLKGRWSTTTGLRRVGEIELRGMRLSQRIIEAIKIEGVGIDISVKPVSPRPSSVSNEVFTDEFCELKVRITNRTNDVIYPLLRLQPSVRMQSPTSLDISKRFVWNGVLQQTLSKLAAKDTTEATIGITALCRGEFEISASVEEARIVDVSKEDKEIQEDRRERTDTNAMMDNLFGIKERRIWQSRYPCVLLVRNAVDDEV